MSSRRNHLVLVGLIVAALVGVALLAIPGSPAHKKPTLGLDLQGGLEVVLQAVPPKGHKLTTEDLDRSVDIMRNRVDKLGVSEPEIRKQSSNQIVIELAGVHDPKSAAAIIGKTAQLELYDLQTSVTGPSAGAGGVVVAKTNLYDVLAPVQAKAATGEPEAYYVFADKQLVAGPITSKDVAQSILDKRQKQKPTKVVTTVTKAKKKGEQPTRTTKTVTLHYKLLARPQNTAVVTCAGAVGCPGQTAATGTFFYLFKHDLTGENPVPQMTGSDLDLSGTRADIDPNNSQPVVLMKFTGAGNKKFHAITRAEAVRGAALGTPQNFAIVLDNQIRTWPRIDYTENPNGIDPTGSGAQITGIGSQQEAKDVALVLQTGALPVRFNTVERTDVSATLGKDSLKQAYRAAIGGLILVALFLLVVYRFLGVVAVLGLGIYAAFLYAALLLFNVTLTLPGFAGMVLTIGVAVDANIVTAITALVLFAVATAGVKGFALMLLIGTVISLATAVVATRAMLGLLADFRWFDNPRFMGASAKEIPRWQRIDVVGRRRLWFILSLVAIALSIVVVAVRGLNLGIDFKGGTQVTFATPSPTAIATVRDQAAQIGQGDAQIQGRGTQFSGDRYEQFQVRTKQLLPAQQTRLQEDLTSAVHAQKFGIKSVSSSFSRQILELAIVAIVVSFILIALFVWMRYRWRFAVPILRTLGNDVLITLGVYSISGREVSTSTVAAILTILGYSIYDTIIVFDRIRENMKLMGRSTIAEIANVSVWEVLQRSIYTSLITLLPIAALFVFGGATLQDFAFAIMVGIIVGAVGTIFIATPLLVTLMERDPEYARRKSRSAGTDGDGAVLLREAERAAAAEPAPEVIVDPVGVAEDAVEDAAAALKRERRKQRRRTRPHGRAR